MRLAGNACIGIIRFKVAAYERAGSNHAAVTLGPGRIVTDA
jgi:hypothetical protein